LRIYEKLNNLEWVDATRVEKNKISPARSFLLPCNGKLEEHVLCLKRNGKGRCIFLGKNNLCRIYSFRPMVCREYPFEKKGGGIRYREGWRCPEEWALDEKIKKEFLRDFERQERELEEYGIWCEEWNKWHAEKGNFGLFIEFMLAKARQPAGRRLL